MGGAQAADDKALWEIGAGVAAFSFPSHRGSDQTNNFLLPVPHFTTTAISSRPTVTVSAAVSSIPTAST